VSGIVALLLDADAGRHSPHPIPWAPNASRRGTATTISAPGSSIRCRRCNWRIREARPPRRPRRDPPRGSA